MPKLTVRCAQACALGTVLAASPAQAEPITAYWRLEPMMAAGPVSTDYERPFFQQRMLPAGLVRLSAAALPAGGNTPVAAGTYLYEVVNDTGKKGYCTLKDRSAGNAAKSLFIPALDRRPCFVDRDGDGRFDASFSVFEAYTLLSPPQPRGSIDAAKPMAEAAGYAVVAPSEFPAQMTISYRLLEGKTLDRTRMRVTVERPGHSEYADRRRIREAEGVALEALGTVVIIKSAAEGRADIEVQVPPEQWVYAMDRGTVALPALPEIGAR